MMYSAVYNFSRAREKYSALEHPVLFVKIHYTLRIFEKLSDEWLCSVWYCLCMNEEKLNMEAGQWNPNGWI